MYISKIHTIELWWFHTLATLIALYIVEFQGQGIHEENIYRDLERPLVSMLGHI